jgi:hypothetical protein
MSEGISKGGGAARGAGRGLMLVAAVETGATLVQGAAGTLPRQRYERGELTQNEVNPLAGEYERKFQGKTGEDFKKAVQDEIALQKANMRGDQFDKRPWWNPAGPGEMGEARGEAMKRKTYLEGALKTGNLPGGTADHTANQMVGGDFQEIGAGYYAAASAYAKAGGDQAAAGGAGQVADNNGMIDILLNIAETIKIAADKQNNPLK